MVREGGEKHAFFAAEISRFPHGKTAVFPFVLRAQNACCADWTACGVQPLGLRIFGKMMGRDA
jgi:hypothetical protein